MTKAPEYEIRLLGPLVVLHGGQTVHLSYQKAAAILAYLAGEGHLVTRERLRTLLWEESDDRRASANLRHALHELRSSCPGLLVIEGDRVGLETDNVLLDISVLKDGTDLEENFQLRRGTFCEGLSTRDSAAFDEWLTLQRSKWDALYLTALMALSDQRQRNGDWDGAMDAAREALSTDPLHEPAHAQIVRLYLARGETAAAHRQLQECQRLLESELGVELSSETLSLLSGQSAASVPDTPQEAVSVTLEHMLETFKRSQQMTTDNKQRIDAELEDLRVVERARAAAGDVPRERVVGPMPTTVASHFKNRVHELELLSSTLARDTTRLVVVCGRGGFGKTALVTRFLHDLLASDGPESVVYVTFRHSEFSGLGKLVDLICRTVEPVAAADLRAFWQKQVSVPEKLEFLFHRILGTHKTLVVLDNLEIILDEENQILEEYHELRAFIESCVEWDHGVRILATSRRSFLLSPDLAGRAFERHVEISVDSGLPESEAVELLHELDADGSLGIRDADEDTLRRVVRACHGIPRTLETLAGTLRQRRTMTLKTLVSNEESFRRLTENPARELYDLLTPEARLVVQALAVFDRPVTSTSIYYLLPGLDVDELLDLLVRNYAVGYDGGKFFLHRLMQQFAYRQIPVGEGEYGRAVLHTRAAELFHKLRPAKSEWKSIRDLDYPLHEFHHLVRAGLFDKAGHIINELDSDYLSLWGYPTMVIEMRTQLTGRLREIELASQNWGRLGVALRETGDVHESLPYLQQALDLARQQGDDHATGVWLANLGLAQGRLGHWNHAVTFASEALEIARARQFRSLEASALGLLGHAYRHLGRLEEALEVYQKAVAITQEIKDRRREGVWWNVLAHAWLGVGDPERAVDACQKAFAIAKEIGHRPGQGAALSTRGKVEVWQGNFEAALQPLSEALDIAREVNLVAGIADTLETIGYAHHQLGNLARAAELYQETRDLDLPVVSYSAIIRHGLVLLEQGQAEAAAEHLQDGIKLCQELLADTPDAFRRLYTLAVALLARGQERDALDTYKKAMAVSSERGVVHEALQSLDLLERSGVNIDKARAVLGGKPVSKKKGKVSA